MSQQKQDRASQVASALGIASAKKQKTLQFTSASPEAKMAGILYFNLKPENDEEGNPKVNSYKNKNERRRRLKS